MVDNSRMRASASDPQHPPLPSGFSEILADARNGSAPACQWLYESVAGRVCGYARLHGSSEPEDVTSEVFLRVFDHLGEFAGDEPGFRSWVFTIAHRLVIDEHRRAGRRPRPVELSEPLTESVPGGNTEADALHAIEAGTVADVLADLVPDQREVLTLRIVGDLTVEQVAQVLGKSRGAVKSLQHRGVAALRRRLEEATP